MKRISSIGTGVVLVMALAVPAAPAVAHGSGHHKAKKRGHKTRHHVVFHRRAHHRLTISDAGDPKIADRIGTIVSFADGVLTIKLDGGKTIEGAVTEKTEIEWETLPDYPSSKTSSARSSDNDEGDDDHGDRDDRDFGDYPGDRKGRCDDDEDDDSGTTADLVPGTVVGEVEVSVTSAGLVFREIELVK